VLNIQLRTACHHGLQHHVVSAYTRLNSLEIKSSISSKEDSIVVKDVVTSGSVGFMPP
jgi:hypothetical protein